MNQLLVDTDVLIDLSRNIDKAVFRLQDESENNQLSISTITQMELVIGCRNKLELRRLDAFLSGFEIIPLDGTISTKAVDLLKEYNFSHGLLMADCFIAATAMVYRLPLLSKNQKDYRFIKTLDLLKY